MADSIFCKDILQGKVAFVTGGGTGITGGVARAFSEHGAKLAITSRKIEKGDILSLNCFPMVAGYYVALERTLFAESATDEHIRLWQTKDGISINRMCICFG